MSTDKIRFTCPKCGIGRLIDSSLRGLDTLCLSCYEKVTVPGSFTTAFYETMQKKLHEQEANRKPVDGFTRNEEQRRSNERAWQISTDEQLDQKRLKERLAREEKDRLERENKDNVARQEAVRLKAEQHRKEEADRRLREEEIQRAKEAQDRARKAAEAKEKDEHRKRQAEEDARRKEEEKRKKEQHHSTDQSNDDKRYGVILGLNGRVTLSDIKRIYKELAMQYHPDKVSHLGPKLRQLAELEMKQINEAYEYFKKKYG